MAWVKVGEVATVVTAGAGNQTISLPDGLAGPLQEADFVMIFRSSEATQINLSSFAPATSGYTEHFAYNAVGVGCRFDHKFLGASPESSVDIPRHSTQAQSIIIQVWRGVNASTPLLPVTATDKLATGSSGMPNGPSITSTVDGSKVFSVGYLRDRSIAATVSAPAGFGDFLAADEEDASLTAGSTVMVASMTQEVAGAVDPAAFGDSSGNGSDDWAAITFELLPAASSGNDDLTADDLVAGTPTLDSPALSTSAPSVDVKTAVVRVAASTVGGDQTINGAGFTPKMAWFIVSLATTDGTPVNDLGLSFGITDGSNQWCCNILDRHGLASVDSYRRIQNNAVIAFDSSGVDVDLASFVAFTSDGVTINWSNAPSDARQITVVFFGGDDFQGDCGSLNNIDSGSHSVTALPYQPDFVLGLFANNVTSFNGRNDTATVGIGWTDGVATASYRFFDADGSGSGAVLAEVANDQIQFNTANGCSISITSDGFTATEIGTLTDGTLFPWCTMNFGGLDIWVGIVDSATAIGNNSVTAPGFAPQLVVQLVSSCDTVNAAEDDGTGGGFGLSVFTPTAESCTSWAAEDAADPTNTQSLADNRAIVLTDDAGTTLAEADFVSMDANGWTLNYTAAPGVALKFPAFAIQSAAGGTSDNLTADDLVAGTPTLDSPALGQVHSLTADDLSAGTPTLESPVVSEVGDSDDLTADDLLAGTPTLDSPTLGQVHNLTADDLLSGTPTLDSPAFAESSADELTADDLLAGTPTLDSPSLGADQGALWPFKINWKGGFSERFQFRTELITARTGREQTRALRDEPRLSYEYASTIRGNAFRTFSRIMASRHGLGFDFAHPVDRVSLTTVLPLGGNSFDVDEVPAWLLVGTTCVLVNGDDYEILRVDGIAGTTVTMGGVAMRDWPVGSRLHLGVRSRLVDSLGTTHETNDLARADVGFDAEPGINYVPDAGDPVLTFNGKEVFTLKPNWADLPQITYDAGREAVDYGYGRVAYNLPIPFETRTIRATYVRRSHEDALAAIKFFLRMKGQWSEFYMPTRMDELQPKFALTSASTSLRIDGLMHYTAFDDDPVNKAIAVALHDGSLIMRVVSDVNFVDDGSGKDTVLILSEAWGQDINLDDIAWVAWMPTWRLASDTLEIEWLTDEVCQFVLPMTTIEDLEADVIEPGNDDPIPLIGESTFTLEAGGGTEIKTIPGNLLMGDLVQVLRVSDGYVDEAVVTEGFLEQFESFFPPASLHQKFMGSEPDLTVEIKQRSNRKTTGVIRVYRNVDPDTPFDAPIVSATGSEGMPDGPAYETVTANAKLITVGFIDDENISADVSAPADFETFVAADAAPTSLGLGSTIMLAERIQVEAGAVDPGAFQAPPEVESELFSNITAITYALRPKE